ncbi:MAG TPA: IclR family transcriptional regulator [Rugosimonospora sp.]|nr:IclR family transcriptional regulator [Rugosimonospora sp.]
MPGRVQSVERAAAILRLLGTSPEGMGVTAVARSLTLPKGTVHGLLRTLEHVGFVEQDSRSGRYRPGTGLRQLGTGHLDVNELRSHCINWADPLAAHSGEAVRIGALRDGKVLVIHHVFRPYEPQATLDVGCRLPPHATALGKVLLAYDPRAAQLLDEPHEPFTPRTLTTPTGLRQALREVRATGWGAEVEERKMGRAAIAAPILGSGGTVVGAVGLAGAVERICDTRGRPRVSLVGRVQETARAVSRSLAARR